MGLAALAAGKHAPFSVVPAGNNALPSAVPCWRTASFDRMSIRSVYFAPYCVENKRAAQRIDLLTDQSSDRLHAKHPSYERYCHHYSCEYAKAIGSSLLHHWISSNLDVRIHALRVGACNAQRQVGYAALRHQTATGSADRALGFMASITKASSISNPEPSRASRSDR